jgi:hypothetical protein
MLSEIQLLLITGSSGRGALTTEDAVLPVALNRRLREKWWVIFIHDNSGSEQFRLWTVDFTAMHTNRGCCAHAAPGGDRWKAGRKLIGVRGRLADNANTAKIIPPMKDHGFAPLSQALAKQVLMLEARAAD